MGVTAHTLAIAAQAKAHTTAVISDHTRQIIKLWATAWDDLLTEFNTEFVRLRRLGRLTDGMDTEQIRQLQRTLSQVVDPRLAQLIADTGAQVGAANRLIITQTIRATTEALDSQLPPSHDPLLVRPVPAATMDRIVQRATQQITVRHYHLEADATAAMKRELILGMAAGDNPKHVADQIIKRVEGQFNGGLTRALVIARTEMMDASRDAALATRKRNRDITRGWAWQATLGTRTCPACWAMHGTVHPVDEPGPLDHHQGRCTAIDLLKSWDDLGFRGTPEPPGLEPTKAEAADAWRQLSTAQQQQILGPKRHEAYQSGSYPMTCWAERRHHYDTDNSGRVVKAWRDSYHTSPPPN